MTLLSLRKLYSVRLLISGILMALILSLCSCFPVKIKEIITLNEDGSGTALITYGIYQPSKNNTLDTKKLFEEINEAARATTGITSFDLRLATNKVGEDGHLYVYTATMGFDLPGALTELASELSECPEIKKTLPTPDTKLLHWDWSMDSFFPPNCATIIRDLPLPPAGTIAPIKICLQPPGKEKEPDFVFLYTFPDKPVHSNAHTSLNEGKTLLWNYNFQDIPQEKPFLSFALTPWYLLPQNTMVGLAGLITGALLATIFTIIRRARKKSSQKKSSSHITS